MSILSERVLDGSEWRHSGPSWDPESLIDVLAATTSSTFCLDLVPVVLGRIVSHGQLRGVEAVELTPDGMLNRTSLQPASTELLAWAIECLWGNPGFHADLGQGRVVARIVDDQVEPLALLCIPLVHRGSLRIIVSCSVAADTTDVLLDIARRVTLLSHLISTTCRLEADDDTGGASSGAVTTSRPLTARQRAILAAMAEGRTNRQIAARIGFSESTVRQETMAIYRHFGVRSRADAVAAATRAAAEAEAAAPV